MPESNNRLVPTPADSDLPTFSILLDGTAISDTYQVIAITVTKAVNRISEAEIIFLDGDVSSETFPISDTEDLVPGAKIEIKAGYHSQEETIFKGEVVKHTIKIITGDTPALIITMKHESYKMTLGRKSKVFADSTDSDAIESILGEYSISKDVASTDTTHENLLQYNATDWDFMIMRSEMNGMVVINENEKVTIKKPEVSDAVLSLYYGTSILEFEAEMDARASYTAFSAKAWSAADQALEEEDGSATITEAGNLSADDIGSAIGAPELDIVNGAAIESTELKSIADTKAVRSKLAKIKGRTKCIGFAALQPGDTIELNGVGERFNGNVFTSGVRHFIAAGKWETDIQFGMDFRTHAELYDDINEKPASGLLPAVNGLQCGVVAQLQDDPKGEDRILVKIPSLSEADEAVWARIATLDAGKERGSFFLPEIGDEVILGFLNDDPRNAIILGMVHSSSFPAPLPASDDNHQKGFITREKLTLLFDDEKKIINIETPNGNSIVISEEDKGIVLTDENGNTITMNSDGIALESAKDVIIKASGDVKIEGTNVELKANANLKGEGAAGAAIKSNAITEIKGSMVNIN
jgi:Rhs element Vgr protein